MHVPRVLGGCVRGCGNRSRRCSFVAPSRCRLRGPRSHGVIVVLSVLKFTVLLITNVGGILVSISSLTRQTGSINVRGYGNTSSKRVCHVFLCRSTLLVLLSLLFIAILLFAFGLRVRSLSKTSLGTLFA